MGQLLSRPRKSSCVARCLLALCVATATAAQAADWELDVDARLLSSEGGKSFLEAGLGTVRFGQDQSGLRLGRARVAISEPFGEVWTLHIDASAWGDQDKSPVGVTEAYLQYRPYPFSGYRLRVKAGAFYAPISLENRASGWESPYTLSSSAINTWLGEELRTIGLEAQLDWLGTRTGHTFDLGLTGAVYGWNEPAGVVLATDGFTLHDRQTSLFGRVGRGGYEPLEPFRQIDGRAGYYGGIEARYLDRVVLRALHYDNRADPSAYDAVSGAMAWRTSFDSAGVRIESGDGWTVVAQWLNGYTYIAPGGFELEWPFNARFVLLSKRVGRHMLSARYDQFQVLSGKGNPEQDGSQQGHAWTAAYLFQLNPQWRFTLEWLRVVSNSYSRGDILGTTGLATETQLQLAVRCALGSSVQ